MSDERITAVFITVKKKKKKVCFTNVTGLIWIYERRKRQERHKLHFCPFSWASIELHAHTHTGTHTVIKHTQVDTLGKHGPYEIVTLLLWTIRGEDVGPDTAWKGKQQFGSKGVI